jgi:hypothetical protein
MRLDRYRACSWREKREVLNAFWRRDVASPPLIEEAAFQYGYYAVVSLVVIAIELAAVTVVGFERHDEWAWIALAAEAVNGWSTWWSVVRYREVKHSWSRATLRSAPELP